MNVFPVNKMILVEPTREPEEEKQDTILVPNDYKHQSLYGTGFVLDVSDDCDSDVSVGDEIVYDNTMLQEIRTHGETHYLLKENYVLCVLEDEEDEL